jgi:hypothetical protein
MTATKDKAVPLDLWKPTGHFRLAILHSDDGFRLADELLRQLPEFGFACCAISERTDLAIANGLLGTMDGMVMLITQEFSANPICNQVGGVALGRGVHLHAIEVSSRPIGFLARIPGLVVPTDSALPKLIAQFVARDPLASQRFSTGVVNAIATRPPALIQDHLACLESLRLPSSEAIVGLNKLRQSLRGEIEHNTETRLDRLIERWQLQLVDEAL